MLLIAMVVSHCSAKLLHIQGLQLGVVLVQPPMSLAQLMVEMLPESLSAQATLACKSTSYAPPYISSPQLLMGSQKRMEDKYFGA